VTREGWTCEWVYNRVDERAEDRRQQPSTPNKATLKDLDDPPRLVMVLKWFEEHVTLRAGCSSPNFAHSRHKSKVAITACHTHDGQTANSFVCLERGRRCVLLLANDVRAEARFADLVRFVLGETGVPYDWEYGDQAGKS
jgi:hypothetical protein